MTNKCAACGSSRMEQATLEGAAVRLESSSTVKKVFNVGGLISCEVCMACGRIGPLRADPEKLAKMLE